MKPVAAIGAQKPHRVGDGNGRRWRRWHGCCGNIELSAIVVSADIACEIANISRMWSEISKACFASASFLQSVKSSIESIIVECVANDEWRLARRGVLRSSRQWQRGEAFAEMPIALLAPISRR
jgi:hypothetical protein